MKHDTETMGISQTREMIRIDDHNPGTFEFLLEEHAVLYIEDNPNKTSGPDRYCMPHMMLTEEFASNAKRIRVTVDIID